MENIELLKEMINSSKRIVVFTGAGVSTDSGIKDFRGKDGLYSKDYHGYSPEYLLSIDCFKSHTKLFFDYYRENFNCLHIKPNIVHEYIKKLEDNNKLEMIITQNIDGLHRKAGNNKICEIHGTIYSNHCIKCNKFYDENTIFNSKDIPKCSCGGIIKPDVVLYGEMLNDSFDTAINTVRNSDMMLVLASSLTVEPASSLVRMFNGKYLVIINNSKTPYDKYATLVINKPLKEVFSKLLK